MFYELVSKSFLDDLICGTTFWVFIGEYFTGDISYFFFNSVSNSRFEASFFRDFFTELDYRSEYFDPFAPRKVYVSLGFSRGSRGLGDACYF